MHVLDIHKATSMFWTYARLCGRFRSDARAHGLVRRFGRERGLAVRDARCIRVCSSVIRGAWLGRDPCAHGRVHGSVATHGLVAMHIRIAHGLNFLDDWAMWLNYRNGHMQLKMAACN